MSKIHLVNAMERSAGAGAANHSTLSNRKMSVRETATYLGISKSFLDKARLDGTGPVYMKLGRRVAYDLGDLESWVASQKRRNTSEVVRLPAAVQS